MKLVQLKGIRRFIYELVRATGMDHDNAETFTDIYMMATLRGVGHHDIYDLLGRISAFYNGTINPNPKIVPTGKYEALEGYDGNNGPGELCCSFIMDRAMELAEKYGIGFCTIKNSNHFLAAAPYVTKAAEKGYFAMIFTRTNPCMGIPGSGSLIGNGPMGFATETDSGYSILLDICLAYASYGTLNTMNLAGKKVPIFWGADAKGNATDNPDEIISGGTPYAIGGHKGFGLTLMLEILTGVLSGGQVIDEENTSFKRGAGVYSQTAIAIKVDGLMPIEEYKDKISEMINRLDVRSPGIRIPGQQSFYRRTNFEKEGEISLKQELIDKLNKWAEKLDVASL